jgi:hypothetical protein
MAVGELEVVVTAPGTPVPLSAESKSVNHFTIQAGKTGVSPGDNTGDIYVGSDQVGNGAGAPGAPFGVRLATGQSYSPPPEGVGANPYNLADYFINADTADDGATVLFEEY